uniref:Uncharacterized protein n=1 Tax=Meloidogyne enterolobii TaxID=390850 RepID=A0A6V7WR77_MELEN|nr:unnamed protein product [Meloidogyne enterolobii]
MEQAFLFPTLIFFLLFYTPQLLIKRIPKLFILFIFSSLFIILLIYYEESNVGYVVNLYGNYYTKTVYRKIDIRHKQSEGNIVREQEKSDHLEKIWVIVIVNNAQILSNYNLAQSTLRCYCQLNGYPLEVINTSEMGKENNNCKQKDFYFQRHCILANFLSSHSADIKFAFFMDADIGVINPNHSLEEFLEGKKDFDLIFYERIFNGEIMAGSYILKNTQFTREFLYFWADYYFKVPNSFHGTDNGAIHSVFLDLFCDHSNENCSEKRRVCSHLWNVSLDFDTLLPFTLCAKYILGARNVFTNSISETKLNSTGKVLLLTDFRHYWARDGWLTGNCWSSRDFLIHGWQSRRLNRQTFAGWNSPKLFKSHGCH